MTDFNFAMEPAQQAPHVVPHVVAHAKHVVHHAPTIIKQGYSMLSVAIAAGVSLLAGFGLGWYVKGRGVTGVQIDASNAVQETEKVVDAAKAAV